jgi:hypothetical protein
MVLAGIVLQFGTNFGKRIDAWNCHARLKKLLKSRLIQLIVGFGLIYWGIALMQLSF